MSNIKDTILVVDDSSVNNLLLQDILSAQGYNVILASDGPSAIEMAKKNSPKLIFLDIMMPGMNGFEVYELLKEEADGEEEPIVIMLTARNEQQDKIQAEKLGAVEYMVKPIKIQEIINVVEKYLS